MAPQNPILKAHLEGVEQLDKKFQYHADLSIDGQRDNLKLFLTTYAESILNAVKEAGRGESKLPKKLPDPFHPGEKLTMHANINYNEGFNDCRTSFHSAINEGIKLIKKGDL